MNMSLCLNLYHGFPEVVPARRTKLGTILPPENFTQVEPMSMFLGGCVFTVKDRHSFDQGTFSSGLSSLTCPNMGNPPGSKATAGIALGII